MAADRSEAGVDSWYARCNQTGGKQYVQSIRGSPAQLATGDKRSHMETTD